MLRKDLRNQKNLDVASSDRFTNYLFGSARTGDMSSPAKASNSQIVAAAGADANASRHWINLGILLTCRLLSFPIAVLPDALREGNLVDQRVATALYGLVAGLMSAAWLPVFPYLRTTLNY
jgi:hypothetical protein